METEATAIGERVRPAQCTPVPESSINNNNRQEEYSRMNQQDNTRIWQWLTLSLIVVIAVATVYVVATVGGAL